MQFFELYGKLSFLFAALFCVGLIFLGCVIYYSVGSSYRKKTLDDGTADEHAEPGVPLVLKFVYLGVALYILVVTTYFAIKGIPI